MPTPRLTPSANKQVILLTIVTVALLLCTAPRTSAQTVETDDAERKRAFQLVEEGKFAEAQEKFEKLTAANPSDGQAFVGLGITTYATAKNIKDPQAGRQARLRARAALLRAKELGVTSDFVEAGLAAILPDGSEGLTYSTDPQADKAMHEGEAAYTRGDYDQAIAAYQRALNADPQLYNAALFIGDMYFQKKDFDKAGEYYGRAIAMDPDRETAYRYWSDALLRNQKMEEARAKAIEAIIAEPYNQASYRGLLQWASANKASIDHPQITQPEPSMRTATDKGQTTILIDPKALDPKQGAAYYWSFYDLTRSAYPATFKQKHPNETAYRHSLEEEAAALRLVAAMVSKDLKEGKLKSLDDASLVNLLKLDKAGLIEAYVLFARADEGIAGDYAAYRKSHRDILRRYWNEIVISNGR